jgi:hypothetical protein
MLHLENPGRARRRKFLTWTTAIPALVGLQGVTARSTSAASPTDAAGAARDVKAYGAVGDGKTDETAALQAAIDAAGAAGGGAVLVPSGIYSTRTLTLHSRVHLIGTGIEATILKLRDGTHDDLIRSHDFAKLTGTNRTAGIFNWSIRDLTLDGNRARNRHGCGLRLYGFGYLLRDLRIRQCRQTGLYSEWSTGDPEWSPGGIDTPGDSMEAQVVNLKIHHCGAGGIVFRGPHDSQFLNCVVYDTTTCGVHVQQSKAFSATGCQFVNGHVWGEHRLAWKIEAGYVTLDNCVGEWAASAQVHVNADDTTITAGRFFGNPKARHVGIEIGTPGRVVYGTQIDARMADLVGGALRFTNEGGSSKIKALIYQTSGIPYSGNPSRTSLLELVVNGIEGGSTTALPRGPLAWNGGTPIVKHLSGTISWAPLGVRHGSAIGTTLTVPGASPGDTVAVGFSGAVPVGALLVGAVTAPDTVAVTLLNQTGQTLLLSPGTLRADCWVH